MGFFFRKSVNLGPFRLNYSKSGIGVSTGVKGARYSVGPRGTFITLGRNGFYYRQQIGGRRRESASRALSDPPPKYEEHTETSPIPTADITQLVESSNEQLLAEINDCARKIRYAPFLGWAALIGIGFATSLPTPFQWIVGVIIVIFGGYFYVQLNDEDRVRRTKPLFYELQSESAKGFGSIQEACSDLSQSQKLWSVNAKADSDWKRNAGASSLVARTQASVGTDPPPCIQTNLDVWSIKTNAAQLFFFPDQLLVFQNGRYGAVAYDSLDINFDVSKFIETERIPKDTQLAGYTWQYVNRNGGPDKRFSNNRQIPVALYGSLQITSRTGLNLFLQVSNQDLAQAFADTFRNATSNEPKQEAAGRGNHRSEGGPRSRRKGTNDEDRRSQRHFNDDAGETKPPRSSHSESLTWAYDTLGVSAGATGQEISAAYRNMAQMYHPDKVASLAPEFHELAERRMKEINDAYDHLKQLV